MRASSANAIEERRPKGEVVWLTEPTLNASLARKLQLREQLVKSLAWLDHIIKIDYQINAAAHDAVMSEDEFRQQVYPLMFEQGKMPRFAWQR